MKVLSIQNDKSETVFIFGAGASYPDGVPLQSGIIPAIFNEGDPQLKKSSASKRIKSFLKSNFPCKDIFSTLEEVFGFIDYFLVNNISLSKEWNVQTLHSTKSDLTKIIHYLISKKTKRSDNFRTFWSVINKHNKNIGVITTNYDTLIDDAFDKIYSECLIDYCIDFINYRHPDAGIPFWWWIDPTKPTEMFNDVTPTRIKLVKIHGSLNWKYCDCCGQVGLTPWDHGINLKTNSYDSFIGKELSDCPFDNNKLSSLIQVPTHLKTNNNYIFNKLYDEALYLICNAKSLVFIGYSFPEADVHIRALIKRGFRNNGKIFVINKSSAKDLRHRYESLAKKVNYHQMPFENFVKSRLLLNILKS
ncbi:MAG TPA: SIR2 family protein [Nitrospinota bacterium]|nr:SIR2 family protein [Nitrospinota bacterium]|tara:strand:+ start:2230 stop:3312 length:1083 start_codon:yes stop_codon:yes gene_type:complete